MSLASDPIGRNVAALQRIVAGFVTLIAGRKVLPRHLHVAMQRLMRPAESAARRLIIAAARGLIVNLPKRRPPVTGPSQPQTKLDLQAKLRHPQFKPGHALAFPAAPKEIRPMRFALLDPLRRVGPPRIKAVPPHAAPRICVIGVTPLFRLPPAPTPQDPINARRLAMRLAALRSALENLPDEAMRFARWQARARRRIEAQGEQREAEAGQNSLNSQSSSSIPPGATPNQPVTNRTGVRPRNPAPPPPPRRRNWRRNWPLRSGRPPGGKQMGLDPASAKGRKITELDEILAAAHALATGHVP